MISSLFLGVSLKVVDEVLDDDITLPPFYLEIFKCLTIVFLVLSTHSDFPFAVSTLLSLGLSYLAGGIDNDYWKSFIIITTLLCGISFTPVTSLWLIPAIWLMPLFVYGEALIFPENSSVEKMLGSAAMVPILGLFYLSPLVTFIRERISNTGIAEKGILFGMGYFLTRAIIKGYIIYKTSPPTTPLPKETENTPNDTVPLQSADERIPVSESNTPPSPPTEAQ